MVFTEVPIVTPGALMVSSRTMNVHCKDSIMHALPHRTSGSAARTALWQVLFHMSERLRVNELSVS